MKLPEMIQQIEDLKESFNNGKSLKDYAEQKRISFLYLTSLLTKDIESLDLAEVYCILDNCPDTHIPVSVLFSNVAFLLEVKQYVEKGFL